MKEITHCNRAQAHKSTGKLYTYALITCTLICVGCDSLRLAPNEAQKQSAWLHNRTAIITAQTARAENTSDKLQALTQLSELQSRAFVSYYGLPKDFPPAETAEHVLAQSNRQLARTALEQSAERPDAWQLADSALELAIGICALVGGVYGTKAARFLKTTRAKSKALQEIIVGNELFKRQNASSVAAFKQAHQLQSPQTRQIVAEMKS